MRVVGGRLRVMTVFGVWSRWRIVIPVLVTGIQPTANVTVQGEMDPGNQCRDDKERLTAPPWVAAFAS
jgi:hypothetical protein